MSSQPAAQPSIPAPWLTTIRVPSVQKVQGQEGRCSRKLLVRLLGSNRRDKIRCDRRMPECNRCEELDAECAYARRMPRSRVRTTADRVASIETALSTILQRLDRIEESCHGHDAHKPIDSACGGTTPGDAVEYQSESEPAGNHGASSVESDAPSPNIPPPSTCSVGLASDCQEPSLAPSGSGTLASVLQHAIEEVQRRVGQRHNSLPEPVDDFHIQPELAKSWIRSYFTHLSEDLFPALLNVQLIELMPDIIGLPNVHLDASILVVYYCILYHGCFLRRELTPVAEITRTMNKLYNRCLRALSAWEPHATGTTADFVAAFFMMRVAAERFDLELSWNMFKRACQYAEKIELHRLDNNNVGPALASLGESALDAGRKGFWELFTIDAYFHLIHNKPPAIMLGCCDAKVNFPWLAESRSQTEEETTTTARFLIDSRRTFILMEFFQLLEKAKVRPDSELVPKTEALCRDIQALYDQWEIGDWARKMIDSDGQLWTVAGLAMEGYTHILFMLRRLSSAGSGAPEAGVLDPDITKFSLAVKASRHILEAVDLLLAALPFVGTVAVTFAVLQAHVPCACLADNLLHSTTPQDYTADAVLLERVTRGLKVISRDVEELSPLTAAMENVNAKVRDRLEHNTAK
ncbi:hypothetical protein ACJZ2D_013139 [Fusarium nematophilum]